MWRVGGGAWSRRTIWKEQIPSHLKRSEGHVSCNSSSCDFGTARFWHGACVRRDVPSLTNNSDCSLWSFKEQTRAWIIPAASKKKMISIVLTRDFANLTFFVPRHSRLCRFGYWPNLQHQLSSPVTILCHMSRSWSTNSLKLHQHSTRCSLCSPVEECGTNLEQIFLSYKSLSKICLAAFFPTPRRSPSSLFVIRLSCITMARVFSTF